MAILAATMLSAGKKVRRTSFPKDFYKRSDYCLESVFRTKASRSTGGSTGTLTTLYPKAL